MSESNKTLAVIGGILGMLVSCITILAFVTGRQNLPEMIRTDNNRLTVLSPSPVKISTTEPESTVTPIGIRNPQGIVPSDVPIIVDDYSLLFDEYKTEGVSISISIVVRNIGSRQRTFRYTANSVVLKDDVGNIYAPKFGLFATKDDLFVGKQVTIEVGEKYTIYSRKGEK